MFTKEDYVTLKVAKILKENGFDEPCEKMINVNNGYAQNCDYDGICVENSLLQKDFVSYPTLYEVLKWFRTKHDIFIDIDILDDYNFFIYYKDEDGELTEKYYSTIYSKSYEEAVNNAIIEALDYI